MATTEPTERPAVAADRADRPAFARAWAIALLLIAHFLVCTLWSLRVPLFNAPDENGHFDYVLYLANYHRLPYDDLKRHEVHWEGHQPPLYYLLMTAAIAPTGVLQRSPQEMERYREAAWDSWTKIASLTDPVSADRPWDWPVQPQDLPAMRLLRLLSALMSTGTVFGVYLLARATFPLSGWLPAAVASLVAFWPQFTFMGGAVNSDHLVNLLSVCFLVIIVGGVRRGTISAGWAAGAGAIAGLAITTKILGLFLLPTFLLALVLTIRPWRRVLGLTCWFAGGVLLTSIWYLAWDWQTQVRLLPGLSGQRLPEGAHAAIAITGSPLAVQNLAYWFGWLPLSFFTSLWGRFGWMNRPLSAWLYGFFAVITVLSLTGLYRCLASPDLARRLFTSAQRRCLWVLAGALGFSLGQILLANLQLRAPVGRYWFVAIGPLSIMLVAGWPRCSPPSPPAGGPAPSPPSRVSSSLRARQA